MNDFTASAPQSEQENMALYYFEHARILAEELGAKNLLYQAHQAFAEAYERIGDIEKAYFYFKKFHEIEQHVFNEESDKKSKDILSGNVYWFHQTVLDITTNGYIHQANSQCECFGSKRFNELLKAISTFSLNEQKEKLETELLAHQQNEPQRKDITVMSLAVGE